MLQNPLVSVIIPCFNQAIFLEEALESIRVQRYSNWECIIVNDGSTDDTEIISLRWCANDSRFKYFYQENNGLSGARNLGIEQAKGDYYQFLDADDYLDKDKLELSIKLLSPLKESKPQIVISNFKMLKYEAGKIVPPFCKLDEKLFNYEKLLYQWEESFSIPIHCGLFDAFFLKNFRFPIKLKAKEDWIMWITIFQAEHSVLFINQPLAIYRRHTESMTMSKDMMNDHIAALDYLKGLIPSSDYEKLLNHFIRRYYQRSIFFKSKYLEIKNSNSYQAGMMIKKILRSFGLIKAGRKSFSYIRTFKKSNN